MIRTNDCITYCNQPCLHSKLIIYVNVRRAPAPRSMAGGRLSATGKSRRLETIFPGWPDTCDEHMRRVRSPYAARHLRRLGRARHALSGGWLTGTRTTPLQLYRPLFRLSSRTLRSTYAHERMCAGCVMNGAEGMDMYDSYTSTVGQYRTYPLGFTHNGSSGSRSPPYQPHYV